MITEVHTVGRKTALWWRSSAAQNGELVQLVVPSFLFLSLIPTLIQLGSLFVEEILRTFHRVKFIVRRKSGPERVTFFALFIQLIGS